MATPGTSALDIAALDKDDDVERSNESATLLGDSTIRNTSTSTTNARICNRSHHLSIGTHASWSATAVVDTWKSLTVTRSKSTTATWSSLSQHRLYAVLAISFLMVTWLSTYSTSGLASSQESQHKDRPTKGKATFTPPQYPIPLSNDDLPVGYKKARAKISDTYLRRGKVLSDELRQQITQQWGMWNFIEAPRPPKAPCRPTWDEWRQVVDSYPNGDVPLYALMVSPIDESSISNSSMMNTSGTSSTKSGSTKPKRAPPKLTTLPWQIDTTYLSQWLPHAMALAERSLEGILGEYGHSKFDQPNETFTNRSYMFSYKASTGQCWLCHPCHLEGHSMPFDARDCDTVVLYCGHGWTFWRGRTRQSLSAKLYAASAACLGTGTGPTGCLSSIAQLWRGWHGNGSKCNGQRRLVWFRTRCDNLGFQHDGTRRFGERFVCPHSLLDGQSSASTVGRARLGRIRILGSRSWKHSHHILGYDIW
jgi:hypothetical protein